MKYTHKIEFSFGVGLDSSGRRIEFDHRAHALRTIRETACQLFGGCTLVETQGDWRSPEGRLFTERAAMLIVYVNQPELVRVHVLAKLPFGAALEMAQEIKDSLNQQAVAVTVTPLCYCEIL